ncbi:hypothetical protein V8F33_007463 [Rhypophila sp. PSN 637]
MDAAGTTFGPSQYPVYMGSWVNWSRGRVFGATLTMTRHSGNLLIAFTALFVAFVSSRFWRIACFTLHRRFSSSEARDALHHQRQAILRNSWSPEVSVWTLGKLLLAWRRSSAKRPFARILPVLAGALICVCAFALAGGFSSQISTSIGDEVLIASSNCGIVLLQQNNVTHNGLLARLRSDSEFASNAANYAQQCYSLLDRSNSSTMFDCNTFAVGRLPAIIDNDAPCPFNETICRSKSNVRFDTGYLDSNEHLGINAPPEERFQFRQVYSCAPLQTDGYTEHRTGINRNFTRYYYGPGVIGGEITHNFTHEVFSIETQYSDVDDTTVGRSLISQGTVGVITGDTVNGTTSSQSMWAPRPELFRPDGSVYLAYFMGDGLVFSEKSTDDWYRATTPFLSSHQVGLVDKKPTYHTDEAAAPLACVEQYQFCRISESPPSGPEASDRCGPLASWFDALAGAAPLFEVPEEEFVQYGTYNENSTMPSIFIWLYYMVAAKQGGGPSTWLLQPGSNTLLSQKTVFAGIQLDSANDQWKKDVLHWWFTYLSILQLSFADVAAGVHNPDLLEYVMPPHKLQEEKLCNNQKIRSRLHTSFSIFGLAFIFVVGGIVTIISYILEPLFHSLDHRRKTTTISACHRYRKDLEWTTNNVLHLQCLSYNALLDDGVRWSKFQNEIPVLEPGDHMLKPLLLDGCGGAEGSCALHGVESRPDTYPDDKSGSVIVLVNEEHAKHGANTTAGDKALHIQADVHEVKN